MASAAGTPVASGSAQHANLDAAYRAVAAEASAPPAPHVSAAAQRAVQQDGAPRGAGEAQADGAPEAAPARSWSVIAFYGHARTMAINVHEGFRPFLRDYPIPACLLALVSFIFGISLVLPTFIANLLTGGALLYIAGRLGMLVSENPQEVARGVLLEVEHGIGVAPLRRHAQHAVNQHLQQQAGPVAAENPGEGAGVEEADEGDEVGNA